MTTEQIQTRIDELEALKDELAMSFDSLQREYSQISIEKDLILAQKQQEIDAVNWNTRREAKELEELKTALKIINRQEN